MLTLLVITGSYLLYLALHISIMAMFAHRLGVAYTEVSFGMGPKLLSIGRIRLRAIPFGGFVKMKDSRTKILSPCETHDAFNHQPLWKQLLLPLSGSVTLLLVAVAILGKEGCSAFLSAFIQIPLGAIGPFSTAQNYFAACRSFLSDHGVLSTFALVATKLSAFNLLPLSAVNGGQALIILAKWGRPSTVWENAVTQWLALPAIILLFGWVLAFGCWVWRSAI